MLSARKFLINGEGIIGLILLTYLLRHQTKLAGNNFVRIGKIATLQEFDSKVMNWSVSHQQNSMWTLCDHYMVLGVITKERITV
jgi:hypothetical protein